MSSNTKVFADAVVEEVKSGAKNWDHLISLGKCFKLSAFEVKECVWELLSDGRLNLTDDRDIALPINT